MAKDKAPQTRGKRLVIRRNIPDPTKFNREAKLPYQLRVQDVELALQDVYDFFYDVKSYCLKVWKQAKGGDYLLG